MMGRELGAVRVKERGDRWCKVGQDRER